MSNLSAIPYIQERSQATPGLWNNAYSTISANFAALNSDQTLSSPSGNTFSILSGLEVVGGGHFQYLSVGSTPPSYVTTAAVTIEVNSAYSDYLYFVDSSAQKSSYVIGSRAGGIADGLNIWDASAGTMIASFSKQSVRFFQQVIGPVFDLGGALTGTYNAATFGTASMSTESRIQAAINQASIDGIGRVYVPTSMYPYSASSMSFIHTVQMVREGGENTVFDVLAYGAYGDNTRSDATAINAALSAASAHGGGVVYLPNGAYSISQSVDMGDTTVNTIYLKGQGRRDCTIRPDASVHTAVIVGKVGQTTSYGNIVDLTITGANVSLHTGCALHMISPQFWTIDNLNIEEFDGNGGTGLFLQGSASASAPHAYRNQFRQLVCVTSFRPGYLKNADENTFVQSQWGLPPGTSGSTMTALEINQGRNNVFVNTTIAGDSSSITTGRPYYVGLSLTDSLQAGGVNAYHQFYGLVCEGFQKGVFLETTNETGMMFMHYNSSINEVAMVDGGQDTVDISPAQVRALFGGAYPLATPVDVSDGSQVPTIKKGNVFNTTNTSLTTITSFSNVSSGQMYWFHTGSSDNFTVILDAVGGGSNIRLWGRSNLTLPPETTVGFLGIGGTYYQATPPMACRLPLGSVNTSTFESPLPFAAKVPGTAITPQFVFGSEVSLGFYRSANSTIQQSYGTFIAGYIVTAQGGSGAAPAITFTSNKNSGLWDAGSNIMGISGGGTAVAYVYANQFNWSTDGTALTPINGYFSERSLGFFRSSASVLRVSYGQFSADSGSNTTPGLALSNRSVGWYQSGAATLSQSSGTLDLALNAVRFSMRTLAASSVTASAAKTNVAVNEVVFTIGGASGASLIIYSGGTAYGFNSAFSAAAS